jgi:hypothetical protein
MLHHIISALHYTTLLALLLHCASHHATSWSIVHHGALHIMLHYASHHATSHYISTLHCITCIIAPLCITPYAAITAPHYAPAIPHITIILHLIHHITLTIASHASLHSHTTILPASLLLINMLQKCATCITTLTTPHVASACKLYHGTNHHNMHRTNQVPQSSHTSQYHPTALLHHDHMPSCITSLAVPSHLLPNQ